MLFKLFIVYLQIGLFSFGGGYAAIPFIQSLCIGNNKWISMEELVDLTSIAEMTPGPIAVNSATFIGHKIAGLWGAIVCTAASILPSVFIVLVLVYLYAKYKNLAIMKCILTQIRPAIVAIIASAGMMILMLGFFNSNHISLANIQYLEIILFIISLYLLRKYKINSIYMIIGMTTLGTILKLLIK